MKVILASLSLGALGFFSADFSPSSPSPLSPKMGEGGFQTSPTKFVQTYCLPCHDSNHKRGNTTLTGTVSTQTWTRALDRLTSKTMPPEGTNQPSEAERSRAITAIRSLIGSNCDTAEAAHVTLRRLNRAEYNNTIQELLNIAYSPADDFPSDDVGHGFDNIGEVLSISPLLMEKYLVAAEKVANKLITLPKSRTRQIAGGELQAQSGGNAEGSAFLLFTNGFAVTQVELAEAGTYKLQGSFWADQAGNEPAKGVFVADKGIPEPFDVLSERGQKGEVHEITVNLAAGKHFIGFAFLNDYYEPNNPNPKRRDRNLAMDFVRIIGPLGTKSISYGQRVLFAPGDNEPVGPRKARAILAPLVERAFRRPAAVGEVDRYVKLVDLAQAQGEPFERGIQVAVTAILASPNFIFRPETAKPGAPLNSYELATRLSYFLWSTMPDDTLFALASNNSLSNPETLKAQIKRMLADPKAEQLGENFATQWLGLRKLEIVHPDPTLFPGADGLKTNMQRETLAFFNHLLRENGCILDFVDSNYTYVNNSLARYYGINGVEGETFQKATWPDDKRGGLLGQASILTLTSNPNRTSPVKRGKWVLENILGTPPPPPPPNVGVLPDDHKAILASTIKERLAAHLKNPACADCHKRLDPVGLVQENFDGAGKWRTQDGVFPVDPVVNMPDGTQLSGPASLRKYLMTRKDDFTKALATKLLTYAIGRGLQPADDCEIESIVKATKKSGYKMQSLIEAVVTCKAFLNHGEKG